MELPLYQCHKQVRAAKILRVDLKPMGENCVPGDRTIVASLRLDGPKGFVLEREIDHEFMERHRPKAGMYFVLYEDDYSSVSPAEAFEKGYTLIPSGTLHR